MTGRRSGTGVYETGPAEPRGVDRGLVRGLAPFLLHNPPRIPARTKTERAALGYLYGNCAMCHEGPGSLASLGVLLDSPAARRTGDADAILTAVSRASRFHLLGAAAGRSERVRPGDPDASEGTFTAPATTRFASST
jgi:hypothetical protein